MKKTKLSITKFLCLWAIIIIIAVASLVLAVILNIVSKENRNPNRYKSSFKQAAKEFDSELSNKEINDIWNIIKKNEEFKERNENASSNCNMNVYFDKYDSDKEYFDKWGVHTVILEFKPRNASYVGMGPQAILYFDKDYNILEHRYVIEDAAMTTEDESKAVIQREKAFKEAFNKLDFEVPNEDIDRLWNEISTSKEYIETVPFGFNATVTVIDYLEKYDEICIDINFRAGRYMTIYLDKEYNIKSIDNKAFDGSTGGVAVKGYK